ncbi:MAG: hypothetical protein ACO1PW_07825 [Actinomycetota bacterium]
MRRLPHPPVVALVAWTFFVWTTRIRNIWTDEALTTAEQWWRTALAGSFTVLAVAVVVALTRRAAWLRSAVLALAVWSVGVWVVRSIGNATADHEVGFVLVHLVLAVVSTVLSVLAVRAVSATASTAHPSPAA